MEIITVLNDIRSTYNVGAILRTCEGFGLKKVILAGYTPKVHDSQLLPHLRAKLDKEIHKTALGAEEMLDIYSSSDILTDVIKLRDAGYKIVGLENNLDDKRLYSLCDKKLKKQLGTKIVLILGEEVHGINNSLREIIDYFIEIPMTGQKESFNVSVATGIALFGLKF